MAYNAGDVNILREGYLVKSPDSSRYLSIMKKWQRKWFRLMENGDLLYFETDKSIKPGGTVHLLDCHLVFDPKTRGLQVNYCIGMEVGESTYYIKADTASSYNAWLKMIAAFADKTEAHSASPAPSPNTARRNTGLTEIKGHQGDSRRFSTSTKVQVDLNSADKSGWLYKTGPNNKGWNHRFFVLANGKLSYYKTEKVEKTLGIIDMHECIAVSQASVKKGYGLTIKIPNRTYLISAETEEEQVEWISALTSATSLMDISKLSVASAEGLVRSGSGSSQSSITSRELFSTSDTHSTTTAGHSAEGLLSGEEQIRVAQEKRPERDSVIQLLEAEVDAVRGQADSLRSDLQSSNSVRAQLQSQLEDSVRQREREVHSITVDRDNLHSKLLELESAKQSLENVNDSLRSQLDEVGEQGVDAEEMMRIRGELEETQAALTTAEDDVKTYQQELSDSQQLLQEIQSVAQGLQSELIRRGDFTPDLIRKNRNLSTTATELLSSFDIPSSSPSSSLTTQLELEERPATAGGYHERREEGDGGRAEQPSNPNAKSERKDEKEDGEGGQTERLAEERLKWQMEMENLRREFEQKEETEQSRFVEEVKEWEKKVMELEETCQLLMKEIEEGRETARELGQTGKRVTELENDLIIVRERVTQLQAEKEKALADLKNIHRINKTIEKRLSETESMGRLENEPFSPTGSDGRLQDLSRQLELMQKERDQLQLQVNKLMTNSNGPSHRSDDSPTKLSPMVLRRKGRATVAVSKHSHAAPTSYTDHSSSISHVSTPLTNNVTTEDAPMKPQRPSKAVINSKLTVANQNWDDSRPKSWSSNMFQGLFHNN